MSLAGLFAVHKPSGLTSRNCVDILKHKVISKGDKIRIGHGGILDSFASGVLVIGIGREYTRKLGNYQNDCTKGYIAEGRFGYSTETMCPESKVVEEKEFMHVTRDKVEYVLDNMIGNVDQRVPRYSAGKVNGMRLSEYARRDIHVELPVKRVVLHGVRLLEFELPRFKVEVECGSGFYVRTLIHEIGVQLDTLATITSLCRTRQGEFEVDSRNTLTFDRWDIENITSVLEQRDDI
jgi:tRNA pseudouridine55 synthase